MGELLFLDSAYDEDSAMKLLCEVVSSPSLVLFTQRPGWEDLEQEGLSGYGSSLREAAFSGLACLLL